MKKTILMSLLCACCFLSLMFGLTGCKDAHTHNYTEEVTAPTCTKQGYTTYTCECGDTYMDNYTTALGHKFTNYVSDNNATCTKDGTKTAKCDGCNKTSTITDKGSMREHVYNQKVVKQGYLATEATCTKKATLYKSCVCGKKGTETFESGAPLGHSFNNYKYNNDATCTKDGTKTSKCSRCPETDTIVAQKTKIDHTYVNNFCSCGAENYTASLIFTLNKDNNSYTVSGISSSETNILIPSKYNNKPVTTVGYEAFNEKNIQSVTFGNNITSIEAWAFRGCKNLIEINLPENLTVIKEGAFAGCEYLDKVTMFDNVTLIEKMAFYQCKRLVKIDLSEKLENIGEGAFTDNYCLNSIILPNSLKSIGKLAFSTCSTLSSIVFPDSLETIDEYAFADCPLLESVTFGTGSLTIGARSFMECVQLTKIYIPKNVKYIDTQAFAYCTSLQEVIIIKGVQSIGSAAFQGCTNIKHMELPFIGHSATQDQYIGWIFGVCSWYKDNATYVPSSLQTIDFSGSTIPTNAMYGCSSITILYRCASDTHTIITDSYQAPSCTEYGKTEGTHCSKCGKIFVEQQQIDKIGHQDNGSGYCKSCNKLIAKQQELDAEEKRHNEAIALYTSEISRYQTLTQNAKNNYGISSVSEEAAYYRGLINECNNNITNLNNSIAHYRLQEQMYGYDRSSQIADCNRKITEENNKKALYQKYLTIAEYQEKVIYYQKLLQEEPTLHQSNIEAINGKYICIQNGCTIVIDKAIPATCQKTGLSEGSHCSVCNKVYVEQEVIPITTCSYSNKVCIYCGSKQPSSGLKFVSNSSGYTVSGYGTCTDSDVVIPSTYNGKPVTVIGRTAFNGYSKLNSITIPKSITKIEELAFYNSPVRTIYFEVNSNLTYIDCEAFSGCSRLTTITIPSKVTTIKSHAFNGCTALKSITLPFIGETPTGSYNRHFGYIFGAKTDEENSTYVPSSLKTVVITGGTTIPQCAFYDCDYITSITIPNSVTEIGTCAFSNCNGLTEIVIPSSVKKIYKNAFIWSNLTKVTFESSSGWYCTRNEGSTSGTNLTLTNSSTNATYLSSTYTEYYWYKKQ